MPADMNTFHCTLYSNICKGEESRGGGMRCVSHVEYEPDFTGLLVILSPNYILFSFV